MTKFLSKIPTRADWIVPFIIAFLSLLMSGYVGYTKTDKDMSNRVTAVETRQTDQDKRMDRIETMLDTLYFYQTGNPPPPKR